MYRVLLVEDEDIIRRGIRNSILWEELGCHVVGEAANGEEGVEAIKELQPDIVITDITMPVMDGLAMIAATKIEYDYAAIIPVSYTHLDVYKRQAPISELFRNWMRWAFPGNALENAGS